MATTTAPSSTSRRSAILVWLGMMAAGVLAIILLHRLGADRAFAVDWSDPAGWLAGTSPERVLLAVGRIVALGLAYWLAGSTLVYTAARASGIPGLVRSVEWMTVPAVRRVAERVVAVSLTVSTFTGGSAAALANDQPVPDIESSVITNVHSDPLATSVYIPVPAGDTPIIVPIPTADDDQGAAGDEGQYRPRPAGPGAASETPPPPPFVVPPGAPAAPPTVIDPAAADREAGGTLSATQEYPYTVVAGDNLWTAAEAHLTAVMGRAPSEAETATYWSHMIDTNRSRLRSGDPDLIFPGEIIVCPPTTDVGIGG